jgi:hypothetical protein
MTANAAGWLTKGIARDVGFWHFSEVPPAANDDRLLM